MSIEGYKEPGAYSQIIQNPGISRSSGRQTIIAIIGEAQQGTFDPILFYDQDSVVAEFGQASTSNPLSLGAELAFSQNAPIVLLLQVQSSTSTSAVLTSTAVASGALNNSWSFTVQDGGSGESAVTVNISSTPSGTSSIDNSLSIVYDINHTYGIPVLATSNGNGTFTLTNRVKGANHTIRIVNIRPELGLPINDPFYEISNGTTGTISDSDYSNALDTLKQYDTNIIVPLNISSTVRNALKSHVDSMSGHDERKERIGIVSGDINQSQSEAIVISTGLSDQRMVYVYPTSAFKYDPINRSNMVLNGSYIACALAGILSFYDPAEPSTHKTLSGFTALGAGPFTRTQMNTLASNGVCVIEDFRGNIRVRHGMTTDLTSADTQEISVVRAVDYTATLVRESLEATYIAKKIVSTTVASISSTTKSVLERLKEGNIIYDYKNIRVKQNTSEPRQIDVRFDLRPVYPCNWIEITLALYSS